ncbi:siderophore-interacting protein [Marinomonas sp. 15G1-11]|uniref:Siderophore-interacting protein n=1 Tax=Marinomonas phaeophyticola TaxID=3004091 RepID=A0ABT4JWE6_9GAMM|nr:siderophore-interacting protein [Marinomonas sp. 15G1-11]MCZ2722659.1 siderophore-interacting protein [Marinomonas sp. 15G1-11]
MKKPRNLSVVRKSFVTPHMIRVTLGGEDVQTLPQDQESAYVKLIFQEQDKRLMRTYTIRSQRAEEIDIDFMLHEDGGPASTWAKEANVGDTILVGGPGPRKMIETNADWYLLVGDMTALPAISVNLEFLPDNAKGYAVIEVVSEADIQTLKHPEGMDIKWVINASPGENDQALLEQVKSLTWLNGQASVWAACEFNSMKALRPFFKVEKEIAKENLYISSYWKLGNNEDQHKVIKQQDIE